MSAYDIVDQSKLTIPFSATFSSLFSSFISASYVADGNGAYPLLLELLLLALVCSVVRVEDTSEKLGSESVELDPELALALVLVAGLELKYVASVFVDHPDVSVDGPVADEDEENGPVADGDEEDGPW